MKALCISEAIVGILVMAMSGAAVSQGVESGFPAKPVVFIAPFAAGGPVDLESRIYAKKMIELTGKNVLVDYKPGANSTIGAVYVAKSPADGYTLLISTVGFTIAPSQYKDLPYDSVKDFAPISQMSQRTSVLLMRPSFPAKNFREYIAYAKANPGMITFGYSGSILVGAWLHSLSNSQVTYVAYKGVGPGVVDLMAGRLDILSSTLVAALPLIKSGKVRPLVAFGTKRSPLLPAVATVYEQGNPDFDYAGNWFGFLAPAATPVGIVNKLGDIFGSVARSPDVVAELESQGSVAIGSTPAQFRKAIITEIARWQKVIQDTGVKLDGD